MVDEDRQAHLFQKAPALFSGSQAQFLAAVDTEIAKDKGDLDQWQDSKNTTRVTGPRLPPVFEAHLLLDRFSSLALTELMPAFLLRDQGPKAS